MEQYLRAYVNYLQDNWVTYLPMAEFAANNQFSETIMSTPFMANYGFHPRCTIELNPALQKKQDFDATATAQKLSEIQDWLKGEMAYTQEQQAEYANSSRLTAPRYIPGDKVWLSSKHIITKRPSRKLDRVHLGPFEIIKPVGNLAYELNLPPPMKIHPVFHVSLLETAADDPLPEQHIEPPPPVLADGEEAWEVEKILYSRLHYQRRQYKVKWVGFNEPSWESASDLDNAPDRVNVFPSRYLRKTVPWDLSGARF